MARTITYYCALISPFTYLGHDRLGAIAATHDAAVELRPIDIMTVFQELGTTPPVKRHPSLQAYRGAELKRWSRHLGLPLTPKPAHFPVPVAAAAGLVMAAEDAGADAFALAGAVLRAVWVQDRDISDPATLATIADEQGLAGATLAKAATAPQMAERLAANTRAALDAGVFGSPSYLFDGELFWGQDRLDMLERALSAAR